MKRTTMAVGSFEVNCSILERDDGVWIVDPGAEAERIVAAIEKTGAAPKAILLTHAHFDHIGAVPALQRKYPSLPVYLAPADFPVVTHPMNQYPPDYPAIAAPANLRDCHELAGVEVIDTPGHTPGGVCYHFADDGLLLSGDTLFAGSYGRTDLPGGDFDTLMKSLERLSKLPASTLVVPGHGMFTTIEREF